MTATPDEIAAAKQILKEAGYVVVTARSYHLGQQRVRVAEAMAADAREREKVSDTWWRETILPELFEYRDRVTFLYGAARGAGCTVEELQGKAHADIGGS